jgi:hypothetical protein
MGRQPGLKHITTVAVLGLLGGLLACGGSQAPKSDSEGAAPEEFSLGDTAGVDFSAIDVCTWLPLGDVEKIVGPLDGEPKTQKPLADERACDYRTDDGHWYDVELNTLATFGIQHGLQSEDEDVEGIGDQAFARRLSLDTFLYVKVAGKATVIVRSGKRQEEQIFALARLAIEKVKQIP